MTICCTESTLLTQKPKIPGITVFVQYEDTIPVENLWRICYTLENTGNRNIIGEGAQSSLVAKGGGLPLYTKNVKKMIQLSATDNNMAVSYTHLNPEVYEYPERENANRFGDAAYCLGVLYYITGKEVYAKACANHLRTWFTDPKLGIDVYKRQVQRSLYP